MRFCVNTCIPDPNGTVILEGTYYDGRYEIRDGGVLLVSPNSGNMICYSPHFWVSVEDDPIPDVDTSRAW